MGGSWIRERNILWQSAQQVKLDHFRSNQVSLAYSTYTHNKWIVIYKPLNNLNASRCATGWSIGLSLQNIRHNVLYNKKQTGRCNKSVVASHAVSFGNISMISILVKILGHGRPFTTCPRCRRIRSAYTTTLRSNNYSVRHSGFYQ